MHGAGTVLATTRPPFLVLSPVCIFLGYSTAAAGGAEPSAGLVWLVFLGALCAHISVNTFNEYFDHRSGLDSVTRRTAFSGGSGALQSNPGAAPWVLCLAVLSLAITIALGGYFIYLRGYFLLVLLVIGVFIIISYTTWLNRHPFLCLMAPGLSFGVLFVTGSHYVLAGEYALLPVYVSLVPFLLTNNLLLLNQYPDISADRTVGRRHFPIAYGLQTSNRLYAAQALTAVALIVYGVHAMILPFAALITLLPLVATVAVFRGAVRYSDDIPSLVPFLALNVVITLLTPVLLAVSLLPE